MSALWRSMGRGRYIGTRSRPKAICLKALAKRAGGGCGQKRPPGRRTSSFSSQGGKKEKEDENPGVLRRRPKKEGPSYPFRDSPIGKGRRRSFSRRGKSKSRHAPPSGGGGNRQILIPESFGSKKNEATSSLSTWRRKCERGSRFLLERTSSSEDAPKISRISLKKTDKKEKNPLPTHTNLRSHERKKSQKKELTIADTGEKRRR